MPEWQHERRGTPEDDDHHDDAGAPPGPPAPFPALINLTVPAGTAYGWSTAPGEAGGWGLTDPGDTRRLLQAASTAPPHPLVRHPARPRRHRRRARLRPRPPPLDPAAGQRPANPRRTRHPAGRRARRTPARAERHPHPDRQRQLRPRQPRRPLHPQPQTQRPDPRPHRPLHRARLRRPGRPLRPRPHPPLPRRHHLPVRPRTRLPPPPPVQASPRLAAHPAPTRRHALDHTLRTQLHHQAHRLRDLTAEQSAADQSIAAAALSFCNSADVKELPDPQPTASLEAAATQSLEQPSSLGRWPHAIPVIITNTIASKRTRSATGRRPCRAGTLTEPVAASAPRSADQRSITGAPPNTCDGFPAAGERT